MHLQNGPGTASRPRTECPILDHSAHLGQHLSRLSNHNVTPGPSEHTYENEAEGRV